MKNIATIIIAFVAIAIVNLIPAWCLQYAWGHIAWEFNLPTFGFWVYWCLIEGVSACFKSSITTKS